MIPGAGPDRDDRPLVLHLLTRFQRGGSEAKTLSQIEGLEGYRFIVGHGPDPDPEQVRRLERLGVRSHEFTALRHWRPISNLRAVRQLRGYLRSRPVDLLHTHQTEAGLVGRLAAAYAGGPAVVHTVHGSPFTPDHPAAVRWMLRLGERIAAGRSDRIVVNSARLRDEYLGLGIGRRGQYRVIPSGVDLDRFADAEPAADVAELPGPVVVYAGRLVSGKGLEELLAAAERLREEGIEFTLVIMGEGPLRTELVSEGRRRRIDRTVRFLGFREDVPRVLAASDLFVLPSHREGTPRVISEAMAAGLPVVATRVGGIGDQVRDGVEGRLVLPGDVRVLTRRLAELLRDPDLRRRMGKAARRRSNHFSVEETIEMTEGLYAEVLERDDRGDR